MNETQTEALTQLVANKQADVDDLQAQKAAAQQTIENCDARLPDMQAEVDALKEGLPTGGETA